MQVIDAAGNELEAGDVVVVTGSGPHAGAVGTFEGSVYAGGVLVQTELMQRMSTVVTARPDEVRLANDIERMRWLKGAREREREMTERWLNSPAGEEW
jgi:hypothetical protein